MTAAATAAGPDERKPSAPAPAERVPAAPPAVSVQVKVANSEASLLPFVAAWEALSARSLDPNVFFEPWFVLPSLRAFGDNEDLRFVFVERTVNGKPSELIGFFPLRRAKSFRGLPFAALHLWDHDYAPLGTPLVDRRHAEACLGGFFEWLASEQDAPLMEFSGVGGDGAFHHALIDFVTDRGGALQVSSMVSRGFFRPRESADAYLNASLGGEGRRKLRSKAKKLLEVGPLDYIELGAGGELAPFTEDFLRLEASGWKGQAGTAMAAQPRHRAFFEAVLSEAHARGRLSMLALRVGGSPVAMKCNFLGGDGSFAWKIAYDEAHGRASPGMHLEVENIQRLHAQQAIRWMDSCANPRSRMFRELWLDRRSIESLVVPTGGPMSELLVAALPLARWARRGLAEVPRSQAGLLLRRVLRGGAAPARGKGAERDDG